MKPTPVGGGVESKILASSAACFSPAAATAVEVRERIEEVLRPELVGPVVGPSPTDQILRRNSTMPLAGGASSPE